MTRCIIPITVAGLTFLFMPSCRPQHDTPVAATTGNFPAAVSSIFTNKCATAGCHNAASYTNAANLRLDTWEHLFEGSNNGAVVVPYSIDNSPLLYYINTDSSRGPVASPTMPLSGSGSTPLNSQEYETVKEWIASGAPDASGNIPFASNATTRQKIYITQQGCDKIAVIDAASKLIMRYTDIGTSLSIESPHCVRCNSTGTEAYVSFLAGQSVQQIDMVTDKVTTNYPLNAAKLNGSWNVLYITPNDSDVVVSDWESDGLMALINITSGGVTGSIGGGGTLVYPHGIASNKKGDTLFVTAQYGNVLYKISRNQRYYKKWSLNGSSPVEATAQTNNPDPHEVMMDTTWQYLVVTCEGTNEVKVLNATDGTVLQTIPVGTFPQEITLSKRHPYFFVTCMEDASTKQDMKGSVYAINYNNWTATRIDGDFYQPHGIAVDDQNDQLYVVSTNSNPSGPAPHHATSCSGRAGWYSIVNMATLKQEDNKRYQLLVLPYSAATRFH